MVASQDNNNLKSLGPGDRQAWIANTILEHGSLLVDDLAELFGVSRMTIHRDLDDLERLGILRKVRNGATALRSSHFESDIRYRVKQQVEEKKAIALKALDFVEPGQAIFLDEASTLLPFARLLADVTPLTVITNFLPIMRELTEVKGIRLIALGGEYLHKYDTFTGLLCEQNVSSLRADLFLTSVTALSRGMLFHPEDRIIRVKRAMMLNASRNLMLLDHTKFGKVAIHAFAPLHEFDVLITDGLIDPAVLTELRETGIRVEVAPINTGE